jgi:hypothetical protein
MKIRLLGAELFHADGQADGRRTDMTKPIVAFRNFAKSLKTVIGSVSQPTPEQEAMRCTCPGYSA